ncbi:hypothetical protein K450DRAFT_169011 [Umbelopsis ramanniana AG]|uniref:Major facilitator superfamily (MFS) profile domain-containing protein n=1 Tax=Umbelopsis ramanniana AG TaxID=1314678 RepID=A0AAD5EIC8_UMBRA|nr:uncharacterized protein K450DRAFT_169011 [Umbelopsis ramanniana AG]KAI8583857.1 hypothetical protein K450DRAFT_169011 [Umbelopsis ramanniana AG]
MDQTETPEKIDISELSQVDTKDSEAAREDDKIIARRLLWKIDLRILPILTLLYIFAAMDRSDLGNAQVAGMQKDLGATSKEWTLVASLFYVGYIVAQPIGTLYLRRINPPVIFSFACCLWGVLTILMLTTKNYGQATAIRVLIGLSEGLLQAAPLYLSLWYKGSELGTRGAIFFSVSSLAGACNGLIAYGLESNFSNKPPFAPWQWLFLIEGIMSTGFAFIVLLLLPPVPENVRFGFTADEKRLAIARSVEAYNTVDAKIDKGQIIAIFKQPLIYIFMAAYSGTIVSLGSMSNFMPSIVQGMGYSSVNAQLMTVPVYAVAFVSTIFFGHLSDRLQIRGPLVVCLTAFAVVGYLIVLIVRTSDITRYIGLCLIALGIYPCVPIILTWSNVNIIGFTRRATAISTINMVAQVFAIVANLLFTEPPYYVNGIAFVLAFMFLSMSSSLIGIFYLRSQNKKKRAAQNTPEASVNRDKSFEEIGNAHPDFFFTL